MKNQPKTAEMELNSRLSTEFDSDLDAIQINVHNPVSSMLVADRTNRIIDYYFKTINFEILRDVFTKIRFDSDESPHNQESTYNIIFQDTPIREFQMHTHLLMQN